MAENTRYYRVTAIIIDGANSDARLNSAASNVAYATTAEATVPGKPEAPRLTPTGAQQIDVRWSAPIDTGGDDITGYRIERSESASSWPAEALVQIVVGALVPDEVTDSDYIHMDTSVPKGNTRWYYRVSAINTVGMGDPSDAGNAATLPVVAPAVPTALTAWEEGPTRIVLHWKAPVITDQEDDVGTGGEITGYKIEYASAADDAPDTVPAAEDAWDDLVADTMSDATTYTDHGSVAELEAGDVRYYRVSAINTVGTSVASDAYSALTGAMAVTLAVSGPDTARYAEKDTDMVATYMVSGPGSDKAAWSLSGADARHFTIPGGVLNFRSAPDFEMPRGQAMSATNTNSYMVTVKASADGEMDEVEVTVTVTNVDEDGAVTLMPAVPSVDAVITATLTDPDNVTAGTVTWQWSKSMDPGRVLYKHRQWQPR